MESNLSNTLWPDEFQNRLMKQFSHDYEAILSSLQSPPILSLRVNDKKINNIFLTPIPWTKYGYYLNDRPVYSHDPHFHAGAYYPQEASSMILEQVFDTLEINTDLKVLDLCAAPGGKSTHILQIISRSSVLISNEIVPKRYKILQENLIKWGYPNFITCNYHPNKLTRLGNIFDVILVDAPCSGEGLFRKKPEWIKDWTKDNCNLCTKRQTDILDSARKLLAPGGIIIYSTCTLNPSENIEQVDQFINVFNDFSAIQFNLNDFGFQTLNKGNAVGYQALPHQVKGEPFFIAVLQNENQNKKSHKATRDKRFKKLNSFDPLNNISGKAYLFQDNYFKLNEYQKDVLNLFNSQNLKSYIPSLGLQKRDSFVPTHFLAMHVDKPELYSKIELSLEQALDYLRHDTFHPDVTNKGWYRVEYDNVHLGWIKYDGRRIINKYPIDWRLRT